MNQPMLELYKQAQEFAYKNISKESWNTDNFHAVVSGKFAELIVKECADWIDRQDETRCPYGVDLVEHFGVGK